MSTDTTPTPQPTPEDNLVTTHHTLTLNDQTLAYTATTGTILLHDEPQKEGKEEGRVPKTSIFFTAYTRDNTKLEQRPIIFAFNGGPGSSSVWLHMGLLGPYRVSLPADNTFAPPPFQLIPNQHTLLDHADLVFIDPVHTGYSRPLPGQKATDFLTFQKDIEWVAEFIRLYTTRNGRWLSPKYLIGESYGTTRAAGLAGHLQDRHGLYLNGIMLVSVVLNFQTLDFHPGNDLPHALYLPTYTATAWYHQRLPADLQGDLAAALNQARHFALNDYTLALMQGDALPPAKQDEIAAQLARFTGLSLDYIKQSNLRIDIMRFVKELLRDQRRTVGRLDSRFTGIDRDAAGESFSHDPSYAAIQGSYTATFNDYIRRHLNFEHDATYEILSFKTHAAWQYDTHQNRYVDVAETLRHAISTNPHLKIFVANGYYDLATPMLATEYTLNHLQLDPARRANITVHDYPAGHMMYIHPPSLAQMKTDLVAFLDR